MKLSESISADVSPAVTHFAKSIAERSAAIGLSLALAMGTAGCENKKRTGYIDEKCTSIEDAQSAEKLFELALKNREVRCIDRFKTAMEKAIAKNPRYVLPRMIKNDESFRYHEEQYLRVIETLMENPDDLDLKTAKKDEPRKTNLELVAHSIEELKSKWGDKNPEFLEAAKLTMYAKMLGSLEHIQVPGNLKFMMDNIDEIDTPGARDAIRIHVTWVLTSSLYDHVMNTQQCKDILSIFDQIEKKTERSDEKERFFFSKMGHYVIMDPFTPEELEKRMQEFSGIVSKYPQHAGMIKDMEYITNIRKNELIKFKEDDNFKPKEPTSISLLFALGRSGESFSALVTESKENSK